MEPVETGHIDRVAFGGAGVTRLDGCVVFVPGVLPGETVRFRIRAGKKTHAQAELVEVLTPSPDRRPNACPFMSHPRGRGPLADPVCAGCAYGHVAYERETALKQEQFGEALARIGGLADLTPEPPLASPRELHYRNKITLHAQLDGTECRLGYLQLDNRTVLDIPACPLAAPDLETLLRDLRARPGFFRTLRDGMRLTLRRTDRDGALYWRGEPGPREPWLEESTPVGPLRVPRGSFFQVNPAAAALLIEAVQAIVRQVAPAWFLDLFCGVGLFSLAAARTGVPAGVGLDLDPAAIAAAVCNAQRHGLDGYRFRACPVERGLDEELRAAPLGQTLLLLDPPRTGLDPAVTALLAAHRPRDIVYVSCAADTLARDLARLTGAGYGVRSARMVDLFPRTAHFESVTWLRLERKGAG